MPRYLIERTYSVRRRLPRSRRVQAIGHHRFPEIVWEHSHVVVGADGVPKSFCVYDAPNEEMVRQHATQLGDHFVETIWEIAGDVTPSDFPLTDAPA
jgi:hypothetical protein